MVVEPDGCERGRPIRPESALATAALPALRGQPVRDPPLDVAVRCHRGGGLQLGPRSVLTVPADETASVPGSGSGMGTGSGSGYGKGSTTSTSELVDDDEPSSSAIVSSTVYVHAYP